ncbi:MAG: BMP family protein [Defluviitaleaceae bacterium]|nr:BMP family protein [Defluviitaleaceae bacterium]
MKKFVKFLPVVLLAGALFAFSACGGNGAAGEDAAAMQIALIAHSPDSILDDGSFNAGAWIGIQQFAASQNIADANLNFFQPHAATDDARIDLIADAIGWGADVLILPGFHFQASLYHAQDMFPETKFVLLDASPEYEGNVRIESNLVAIHYAEEESGFLAGYAAVMDGYRNLGFMGGIAVPAVVRFGHGFIQGAEHAANELGLDAGAVEINFMYLGGFAPDPAHVTTAGAWFATGTEVIFAAAGGAGFSVIAAAESAGASVIGVDVDQADDGDVVVTSAVKGLAPSVYAMLEAAMNNTFPGGREMMFNAAVDGVGLPMETARLQNFTQAQYDAIFAQLASGAIRVSPSLAMDDIQTSLVVVNEM